PAVVPALARALDAHRAQDSVVAALAENGPAAVAAGPPLVKALEGEQETVPQGAARAPGRIGPGARGAGPGPSEMRSKDREGREGARRPRLGREFRRARARQCAPIWRQPVLGRLGRGDRAGADWPAGRSGADRRPEIRSAWSGLSHEGDRLPGTVLP